MEKKILALQLPCVLEDKHENFKAVKDVLGGLCTEEIDFLFLSELFSIGWCPEMFFKHADNETLEFLQELARAHNINIIGGSYIRRSGGKLYNSCPIINRNGEVWGHYDKNHLFEQGGEAVLDSGEKLTMFDFEGLRIALSICYDIRFPELFREYMKTSAPPHLIVNMAAWPKFKAHHYEILSKARAVENQTYFLGVNQCGELKGFGQYAGGSILVDPFGETVEQLDEEEGYILKTIDTQKVAQIREKFPNLAATREGGYEVDHV